jgi:hypothetical protein
MKTFNCSKCKYTLPIDEESYFKLNICITCYKILHKKKLIVYFD